jgi:predicted RNA-binding protein YlqC (UPF0109 family)
MQQNVSGFTEQTSEVVGTTAEMLIEIARSLVQDPNRVSVRSVVESDHTNFILRVASHDLCKVFGKQGRTARSIRTVVNAIAVKANSRFNIEIEPDAEYLH